jgi:hypothetical protein
VPKRVFLDVLRQGVKELVEPLLQWEGPDAMRNLWCNMRKFGSVMSARRAREAGVMGFSVYESEEIELEDEDGFKLLDITDQQKSPGWWEDEISGCLLLVFDTVISILGFYSACLDSEHSFACSVVNLRVISSVQSQAPLVPRHREGEEVGKVKKLFYVKFNDSLFSFSFFFFHSGCSETRFK